VTRPFCMTKQSPDLFRIIRQVRDVTDEAIVAFSGGKDALVTLELCRHFNFRRIVGFFMALVPDLSFQESYLNLIEKRYGIEILRVPHVGLSDLFKTGTFRFHSDAKNIPKVTIGDMRTHIRERTGIQWVLSGEKKSDSLTRRGWLTKCEGIQPHLQIAYPVADWTDKNIWSFINHHNLPVAPDYRLLIGSFSVTDKSTLIEIYNNYPEDFERIERVFPFVRAVIAQAEFSERHEQ